MQMIGAKDVSLNYSNVSEALHSEWSNSATYNANDLVYVTLESDGVTERKPHKIYKSLAGSNFNKYPPDNTDEWVDMGPTNRWAMFDSMIDTPTRNTDSIVCILSAQKVNAISFFGLVAESVQVLVIQGEGVIQDTTESLRLDNASRSWSEYFFDDIQYKQDLTIDIGALYLSLEIQITITAATGTVAECGHCHVGKAFDMGVIESDVRYSMIDYSNKEADDFGQTVLVERPWAKQAELNILVKPDFADLVNRQLIDNRATPVVWDGNHDRPEDEPAFEMLQIFGIFREYTVTRDRNFARFSVVIEGLI